MEALILEGSTDTPGVNFDKNSDELIIKGSSMPEDVKEFYSPIMNWIDAYFESPNDITKFVFEMVYFNTASSKMILDIMYKLKDGIDNGNNVEVTWKYYEDDEEMMEAGEDFAEIVEMPIELVSIYHTSKEK